jgi:hypothetical protein
MFVCYEDADSALDALSKALKSVKADMIDTINVEVLDEDD